MTKPDLQKQREQDTWIDKILEAVKVSEVNGAYTYKELGKDFIRFYRGGKLWELSIKEKKPRKKKV